MTLTSDCDLRQRWELLGFDVQRALVVEHVARVAVAPAVKGRNRFDPERVSIQWR